MSADMTTKVLIVGAGPTGLFASLALSKYKIPHILIEQRKATQAAPAAHVINTRTMEIFRQVGLPMDEIYALNCHIDARFVTWLNRPGEVIGHFDLMGNADSLNARMNASQDHMSNISQPLLEAFLLAEAKKSPLADIRFGVTWQQFVDEDTHLSQVVDPDGKPLTIRSEFTLAADGAASGICRSLKIKKVGPDAIATFLNLSCEVDMRGALSDTSTLIYWLLDPETMGTAIVHDPEKSTVFMRPLASPYESIEDYDDTTCLALLGKVFGDRPFKLLHKSVWRMTAQLAEKFRHDNVFLIGDSAHRFPPTGGLGLNTGVGDVHNLVWKIAAMLGQVNKEGLLDTYELERRPVAQQNCDVSYSNHLKMTDVMQAIGLDTSKAHVLPKIMNHAFIRSLPGWLQQTIRNALLSPVKAKLNAATATDASGDAIRSKVQQVIEDQREHFDTTGLELGYVYREGCAVSTAAITTVASEVSTYKPNVGPGSRLPHVQILVSGKPSSTLDLLDYRNFTLLHQGEIEDLHQGEIEDESFETFGLPITRVNIAAPEYAAAVQLLAEQLLLTPGNWILVRPDGHIMASSESVI